ncbi:hypothetical protein RI367_001553 [Sorochytrium milnesiophthora]
MSLSKKSTRPRSSRKQERPAADMTKKHKRKAQLELEAPPPAKQRCFDIERPAGATKVSFNLGHNAVHTTWDNEDYDRSVDPSEWWRQFESNKASHAEAVQVYWDLDVYKLRELWPTIREQRNDPTLTIKDALSILRLDILNTLERIKLVQDKTDDELYAMTLPEIQNLLGDYLIQYDQEVTKHMSIWATYTEHLSQFIYRLADGNERDPLLKTFLAEDDKADEHKSPPKKAPEKGKPGRKGAKTAETSAEAAATVAPTKRSAPAHEADVPPPASNDNGIYFDVPRVFLLATKVSPVLALRHSAIAQECHMSPEYLSKVAAEVKLITRYFFTGYGQPIDPEVNRMLTSLILVALGRFDTSLRPKKTKKSKSSHTKSSNKK